MTSFALLTVYVQQRYFEINVVDCFNDIYVCASVFVISPQACNLPEAYELNK